MPDLQRYLIKNVEDIVVFLFLIFHGQPRALKLAIIIIFIIIIIVILGLFSNVCRRVVIILEIFDL